MQEASTPTGIQVDAKNSKAENNFKSQNQEEKGEKESENDFNTERKEENN